MEEILLVGNPNTGKTTLFNSLTKSDEHVGNWHGVTVDSKKKKFKMGGQDKILVDLPGLYSLSTLSFEEQVTVDELISNKDSKIINICDINNLQQNLYLSLQLKEMNKDFVLCLNDTNTKTNKSTVDIKKLSEILGVNVVLVDVKNKKCASQFCGLEEKTPQRKMNHLQGFEIEKIRQIIEEDCKKQNLDSTFCAIKLLENDIKVQEKLNISQQKLKSIEKLKPEQSCSLVAKSRHDEIKKILQQCNYSKQTKSQKLNWFDKIATHKVFGVLLFFAILLVTFYLTFFSFGKFLSDGVRLIFEKYVGGAVEKLTSGCAMWAKELLMIGVVGGLSSLLGFLPQIVLLFLFLSILEESGYMSRVAFMFDDIFSSFGLSGKSVYTLMMGFGCSTTAIMTARNMEDKNSQIKTALLAPYMSCSAKLPIYLVLGGAFFAKANLFVVFFLYILGVAISILISVILEKTVLNSKSQSFILEMPQMKLVGPKKIFKSVWKNFVQFLTRVGTLLVFVNVIVWVLQSFSFKFAFVATDGGKSMLETISSFIAPIFKPLGFGSWGAASALVAGFVAKEIIISSIAIINGVTMSDNLYSSDFATKLKDPISPVHFTPASALAYLVFCLLYTPCMASVAVLRKEVGRKWTWIAVLVQLVVAWIVAFVIYTTFLVFTVVEKWKIISVACAILILVSVIVVVFKKKKCAGCSLSCDECSKRK